MRNFIIIILANITLEAAFPIVVVASGLAGLMIAPMNWMAQFWCCHYRQKISNQVQGNEKEGKYHPRCQH